MKFIMIVLLALVIDGCFAIADDTSGREAHALNICQGFDIDAGHYDSYADQFLNNAYSGDDILLNVCLADVLFRGGKIAPVKARIFIELVKQHGYTKEAAYLKEVMIKGDPDSYARDEIIALAKDYDVMGFRLDAARQLYKIYFLSNASFLSVPEQCPGQMAKDQRSTSMMAGAMGWVDRVCRADVAALVAMIGQEGSYGDPALAMWLVDMMGDLLPQKMFAGIYGFIADSETMKPARYLWAQSFDAASDAYDNISFTLAAFIYWP